MRTKSTPLRRKLIALLIVPLLFFGLLELALRAFGFRYSPPSVMGGAHPSEFGELENPGFYVSDPDLLWRLRPGAQLPDDDALGFVRVRTNSLGLRGAELPIEKEPDEVRILCLGDSVTFGIGLDERDTWPCRLQVDLEQSGKLPAGRVRVINGGVPGWSAVQGVGLLDRLEGYGIDLVVFWFGMNDSQKAYRKPDVDQLSPPGAVSSLGSALRAVRVFQLVQATVAAVSPESADLRRVSMETFRGLVAELRNRSSEGGPRVVFVRCPQRLATNLTQLETVASRMEEEGVERAYGPYFLLSPIGPAAESVDLIGKKQLIDGEPVLVFDPRNADADATLVAIRENIEIGRRVNRHIESLMLELPEDRLDADGLFGATRPERVFRDVCHLRPLGSALAARAIARRIETLLSRPPPASTRRR